MNTNRNNRNEEQDNNKDEISSNGSTSSSSSSSTTTAETTTNCPSPLELLSEDVGGYWAPCREIPILSHPPSSLEFLRDYVSPSIPCIIRCAIVSLHNSDSDQEQQQDDPLHVTLDQLVELAGDCVVTVNVTPDGHGDCVRHVMVEDDEHNQEPCAVVKMFVKPEEKKMTLRDFRRGLRSQTPQSATTSSQNFESRTELNRYPVVHRNQSTARNCLIPESDDCTANCVLYYSQQNDCLRTELLSLFHANIFPSTFKFAEEAFGTGSPDAINLWVGNEQSVSSMHKDHYENLFYVCSGEKVFTLCPPADVPFLHSGQYPSGTFCQVHADPSNRAMMWVVVPDSKSTSDIGMVEEIDMVQWMEPDIQNYQMQYSDNTDNDYDNKFPLLKFAHPIEVRVKAGEMLYLPSLWFHRVTQSMETVGVNYWYDMKFDSKWCYFNFLQRLGERITSVATLDRSL